MILSFCPSLHSYLFFTSIKIMSTRCLSAILSGQHIATNFETRAKQLIICQPSCKVQPRFDACAHQVANSDIICYSHHFSWDQLMHHAITGPIVSHWAISSELHAWLKLLGDVHHGKLTGFQADHCNYHLCFLHNFSWSGYLAWALLLLSKPTWFWISGCQFLHKDQTWLATQPALEFHIYDVWSLQDSHVVHVKVFDCGQLTT